MTQALHCVWEFGAVTLDEWCSCSFRWDPPRCSSYSYSIGFH